jgi:ATP-binding cassette subfamily F protein uup
LLLVSHDRQFVDNTVTTSWIFEGNGIIEEFVGGYHDAQQQRAQVLSNRESIASDLKVQKQQVSDSNKLPRNDEKPKGKPKKLSYKLQRELEALPERLETLETEIGDLQTQMNDPDFFTQSVDVTQPILDKLSQLEAELEEAFERWEELEALQQETE